VEGPPPPVAGVTSGRPGRADGLPPERNDRPHWWTCRPLLRCEGSLRTSGVPKVPGMRCAKPVPVCTATVPPTLGPSLPSCQHVPRRPLEIVETWDMYARARARAGPVLAASRRPHRSNSRPRSRRSRPPRTRPTPGPWPSSTSGRSSQSRRQDSESPKSLARCATGVSPRRASATTSSRTPWAQQLACRHASSGDFASPHLTCQPKRQQAPRCPAGVERLWPICVLVSPGDVVPGQRLGRYGL
jgi:hypothetical protein